MTEQKVIETGEPLHDVCVLPVCFGNSTVRLSDAPSAAYILDLNPDFTLLCGNDKFYDLLGIDARELSIKYGNRMAALFDTASLRVLTKEMQHNTNTENLQLEQCVQLQEGHSKWIRTYAIRTIFSGKPAICCFSNDITSDALCRDNLSVLKDVVDFVIQHIRYEMFIYDTQTGSAQVHTSHVALRELFPQSTEQYPRFLETMLESGMLSDDSQTAFRERFEGLTRNGARSTCEIQLILRDGSTYWALFSLEYFNMLGDNRRYAMGILEDITQQKEALRSYLSEAQFFQSTLAEKAAYGQVNLTTNKMFRAGGIWDVYNESLETISYSDLLALSTAKVIHPDDRALYQTVLNVGNLLAAFERGIERTGCDFRRMVSQNKMAWMKVTVHLFRDSMTRHVMALMYLQNIDAEKKQHLSLLRENERDHLTGIYNKIRAEELINAYLHNMPVDELCVLMILDIDGFRKVNDAYGHQTGDAVLRRLAGLLGRTFRKNDIIGRFGGDEFIVFLKDIDCNERITMRLKTLYEQLALQSEPAITCSIGVAVIRMRTPYETLLQRADSALYAAKKRGVNHYTFYDETQPIAQDRPSLQTSEDVSSYHAPETCTKSLPDDCFEFDHFLSQHGDIAYLVDTETYDLICGNNAMYDRLGITPRQGRVLKCYEALQGRTSPCPFCTSANWSRDRFYIWRNMNRYLQQEFLIKNKIVLWNGHEALLAIAIDVSNNKAAADSIENANTESRDILSGIQRMTEAETDKLAMTSALETTASFFRASSAQLWEYSTANDSYHNTYSWSVEPESAKYAQEMQRAVDEWLHHRKWSGSYFIENPNVILSDSYMLYHAMRTNSIRNQRWFPLPNSKRPELPDFVLVQNIMMHFRNISFMESFCGFIAGERKRRALLDTIVHASSHDKLTNLLNRESYDHFIYTYDPDRQASVGVAFADFDGLKNINARRGYHIGDKLLVEFSEMLTQTFPTAMIFRLNGDEFLIVQFNLSQDAFDDGVRELRSAVARRGQFSISVGHIWDNLDKDLNVMMENASQVMRVNKKRHYDSTLELNGTVRTSMLQELLLAIERREFEIFLQPKVELASRKVIGAEALIRYRHKELGIIPPAQFIDMMERNDFIRYVDLFVFEEVCRLLEKWASLGWSLPSISMNFSRLTLLETDIVESVETIFSQFQFPKKALEIEITESFADMGKGVLSRAVSGLFHSGFAISLDDFGTKYTNLALLSSLPFNVLKLDRSLCSSLSDEPRNQVILKNIINMCRDLNISVIAEGIEQPEQEDILRSLGCCYGQGYLYGRPMEITEFERQYSDFHTAVN